MKIKLIAALAIYGAFLVGFMGCSNGSSYQKREGMIWNTLYHITYNGKPELGDSALKVLEEVGKSLSVFDSISVVARVNRSDSTIVDFHFKKVYDMSRKIHTMSGGSFDPTLSPLITIWGFGKGHSVSPDTARIDDVLNYVGLEKTALQGLTLKKEDPRIEFNFSAIAKGYGCDAVGEMFRRNGVDDWLVEIGGEIAASGVNPEGSAWRVSVEKPEKDAPVNSGSAAIIELGSGGIATSGNYRNYHEEGGRRFGHTIDASTGRPSETDVLSATVIAPTAMEADALATSIMAMGSRRAKDMIKRNSLKAMMILTDSTVWGNIATK